MHKKFAAIAIMLCSTAFALDKIGFYAKDITVKKWITQSRCPLEAMAGQPYLIEFWATWCGPCVTNVPQIEKLYAKYGPKGLRILGLSLDRNESDVVNFVNSRGIKYPVAIDDGTESRYGISGIPAAVLVDAAGVVVWSGHPGEEGFEAVIAKTLENVPPPVLDGLDVSKFKDISTPLREGGDFVKSFKELKKYAAGNTDMRAEAKRYIDIIELRIGGHLNFAAQYEKKGNFRAAKSIYSAIAQNYEGTDGAAKAAEKLRDIAKKK